MTLDKSTALCSENHFLNLQQRHLKFYYLSFGTDKTTICYAKYIHTYTSEMKKWWISGTRESLQISKVSLYIAVYIVSYIYESHTLSSYVTSFFGANKYLI